MDDVVWTGKNVRAVSRHLFPVEQGALTSYRLEGKQHVSLLAFGVMYDLPVGCRIVRTNDGTVTVDATDGCETGVQWLSENEGEAVLNVAPLKTWQALCRPTQPQEAP